MYFVYPFAINGNVNTIPPTAAAAVLSYQYGFGIDFELPLDSNPSALPIPRSQFNQLMLDITTAIQQYQQVGVPPFILASQNLGVPFPYVQYAQVYYSGQVYENQVPSNTATPGTDTTWKVVSGITNFVPTGTVIDYAGVNAPMGYLPCFGSQVARATYGALLTAITFTATGNTDGSTAVITGVSSTVNVYVGMAIEGTGIPIGSTVLSFVPSTSITISQNTTAVGTGVTLTFFPWGNGNGTTLFNLPNFNRSVAMGSAGGMTSVIGNNVGQVGGLEAVTLTAGNLPPHTHDLAVGTSPGTPAYSYGSTTNTGTLQTGNNATGIATPVNVVQPSCIVLKCIKT